ncbi:hypothetical protein [Radiobacillus sp. PE A8.2]|uniref:hypothetical protein n=1 Tax=Radiobacillus sp. PE A8.2 TaxID=3380349 RepID=UPI00388DECB4
MVNRRKKFLIFFLILLFIFVIIPLAISISYGNIPFYNDYYLDSYDVLVSNDKKLNQSEISFINYNTYTRDEIKQYIIRNEMSFFRVFRNTVVFS